MDCYLRSVLPTTRRAFNNAVTTVAHADDVACWCVVWGRTPAQPRVVVSLFHNRWMLYDRYGQFRFETESAGHAHLQRGETSHVPSARAGAQDVPKASYKPDDGRGGAPELGLTRDALVTTRS